MTVGEEGEPGKFGVSNEIRVKLPRQGHFKADVSSGGAILLRVNVRKNRTTGGKP